MMIDHGPDIAAKTPIRDALYDFVDAIRLGAVVRLDYTGRPETICIGGRECLDQIAYAVEKHLRQ